MLRRSQQANGVIDCIELSVGDPDYPDLLAGLNYWNLKRGKRFAPSRSDIEPNEIVQILPRLKLIDVLREPDDGLDFRFRLTGTEIGDILGIELTHSRVSDLQPPQFRNAVHSHYVQCVTEKRPLLHLIDLQGPDKVLYYARLLLPLSSDGQTVNMLMTLDSDNRDRPIPHDTLGTIRQANSVD